VPGILLRCLSEFARVNSITRRLPYSWEPIAERKEWCRSSIISTTSSPFKYTNTLQFKVSKETSPRLSDRTIRTRKIFDRRLASCVGAATVGSVEGGASLAPVVARPPRRPASRHRMRGPSAHGGRWVAATPRLHAAAWGRGARSGEWRHARGRSDGGGRPLPRPLCYVGRERDCRLTFPLPPPRVQTPRPPLAAFGTAAWRQPRRRGPCRRGGGRSRAPSVASPAASPGSRRRWWWRRRGRRRAARSFRLAGRACPSP